MVLPLVLFLPCDYIFSVEISKPFFLNYLVNVLSLPRLLTEKFD